jgi:DNA-binding PadR family transcriptional regulator
MNEPPILILTSLAGGPKHGYAIMDDVLAFSGSRLGPGTLYGALARLEEKGWIRTVPSGDRRHPYAITAMGRDHLRQTVAAADRILSAAAARLSPAAS